MYLETILILSKKQSRVRAVDVGEYMGFSKPSVSHAMSLLRSGGYVVTKEDGCLCLTDIGREVAEKTYERHTVLTRFFVTLGVSEEVAAGDACKIEHDISDESFEAIRRHFEI